MAEQADLSLTDREAALQAEIDSLETQLESAMQTISSLETELNGTAGQTVAEMRSPVIQSSEVVSRVPASVTSLGVERLSMGGVQDHSRLEYLVPGLRYGQTGSEVRISMRGTRTNSVGPEADSVVGVYEDGIYLPTSTSRYESYLDVDRVEVLRGPQVTTFGQHSYAGAISIVSNKPTLDGFTGYAEAENAIPDKTRWKLALNIPVGDTLAFRIAGLSESRSGLVNNLLIEPDSDDLNDRNEQTIRSSLLWQPNDKFSMLFMRKFQDENGTGSAPWGYQQIGAYVDGEYLPGHQFAHQGIVPDIGPWDVFRNFISSSQFEHEMNTLDLNWNMGFASLQWLSNVSRFSGSQTYDNDYSTKGDFISSSFIGRSDRDSSQSSELRLTSNGASALDWVLGFYWSERESNWRWLAADHGIVFEPDWNVDGKYKVDSQALFGQASYRFGDRLTLTGGLRWNEDSKTLKSGEEGSWDDVLYKAALQYDFSNDLMTYVSASSGYVPGGINSAPGVNPAWEPEKLTAYELGLKGTLADGELQMSLAAWFNDFKDVQSQSFLVMPFPGSPEATEYTGNGGSVDAKGFEAEIQWTPNSNFYLATNIAYTDASFGDYTTPNLAGLGDIPGHTDGDQLSLEGWRPALSPEWVVGLQTSYTFTFENWGTLTPYLQTTYASDYYVSDLNLAGVQQEAHARTDIRLIWQAKDNFQIQLYFLNYAEKASLNWARVYNPAARPDITTLQANWNKTDTNGIIFNFTF
jgi:iron complex outermembrane receptor protein